jgi:hypothetical protein
VVADALSCKSYVNMTMASRMPRELYKEFEQLNLGFVAHAEGITMEVEPTLEQEIRKDQLEDPKIQEIKEMIEAGKAPNFTEDEHGMVWVRKRIDVPHVDHLHEKNLKDGCWWYGMKHDVAAHVALCNVCQRVKAEHQRLAGLLQPLKVLEWKWKENGMDFIMGLPRT